MDTPPPADNEQELTEAFEACAAAQEKGDAAEAQAAALEAFAKIAEQMEDQPPSPWLVAMEEAHRCEAAFDWPGAEAAYQRGITDADSSGLRAKAYENLAAFYHLLGRDAEALATSRLAAEQYRSGEMAMLVPMALQTLAGYEWDAGNRAAAWELLNEAFSLHQTASPLSATYPPLLRARFYVADANYEGAEVELANVWPQLEAYQETLFLAGYQNALAKWWTVTARLRAARGDAPGAVAAWRENVHRRRIIAQCPQLEGPYKFAYLAGALHALGRALHAAGDSTAGISFSESRSLRQSIGLPPLPED